ncbi:MAG: FtsX-like permease family protein [Lachnospiraceae bacterium]|nr:FtsX-like permease family protein [Lachnospiraceae bacterium]
MKKTQWKDTIRNILKEKVSYLSIMIIALLAVTAYLGINFGAEALRVNANRYYQKLHYRDLELSSTMLLGEDDLAALLEQEGVADAEGVFETAGKTEKKKGHQNLQIVSLTEKINTVEIIEGRLPASEKECVLEEELMQVLEKSVGDTVTVTDASGDIPAYLNAGTFTVTGSVHHPDHYAYENQAPGKRYLLVLPEAFDKEALNDSYMKAVIRIDKKDGISYFDRNYKKLAASVQESLKDFCTEREEKRTGTILDQYDTEIADAESSLEEGRGELENGREELDENARKIEEGEKELENGKKQLEDAEKGIAEGEEELKKTKEQLDEGKKQLDEAFEKLNTGRETLASKKQELDKAKEQLEDSRETLNASAKELTDAKNALAESYNEAEYAKAMARYTIHKYVNENADADKAASIEWEEPSYITPDDIDDPGLTSQIFKIIKGFAIDLRNGGNSFENLISLLRSILGLDEEDSSALPDSPYYDEAKEQYEAAVSAVTQWDQGHEQYLKGKKQYEKGLAEYNSALARYEDGVSKYNEGLKEYQSGLQQYNEKEKEYENGTAAYKEGMQKIADAKKELDEKKKEYDDSVKKIREGKEELAEGEEEYAEGVAALKEGEEELDSAKEKRNNAGKCHFVLLPTRGNTSFTHAEDSAENVGKIGMTFALLFVLLGALVIYATVGRIIGEQRTLVGTQKALGLFSSEVFRKYLGFGATASACGIILGTAVGYSFVQKMVLVSHEQFYVTGVIPRLFRAGLAGAVFIIGVLLSSFAVFWACSQLLRENAKDLMQEQAPKGRKRAETKKRKGSLYSRLILRNMLTDWQRVLITIISVAGCCVLLVIGFTMKSSIYDAIDRQFEDILMFTDRVTYDPDTSDKAKEEIAAALDQEGIRHTSFRSAYHTFDSPEGLTSAELICVDKEEIPEYFRLRETDRKSDITMEENGIYITRRISEAYGLHKGDVFTIYDESMNPTEAEVAGVFEYYFGKIMLISKDSYQSLFGKEPQDNAFWIRKEITDEALQQKMSPIEGFEEIISKESTRQRYLQQIAVLGMITGMLIVAAGMMAFFVLLNLINMYLNKKKKELTVMRINGFSVKEVIRYVAGESEVTTVFGILLGLLVGSGIGYLIVRFIEQSQIGLMRNISIKGWLYSAVLTAAFALVINIIALRKVKTLKLSDMQ